jgi:hypothetical protein
MPHGETRWDVDTSRFIVVDPSGMVRATLAGDETSAEQLVRTAKRALGR